MTNFDLLSDHVGSYVTLVPLLPTNIHFDQEEVFGLSQCMEIK